MSITGDFVKIHDLLAQHRFRVVGRYNGGLTVADGFWGDVLMMREGAADLMAVGCAPFQS
jgi:hypothetical protein